MKSILYTDAVTAFKMRQIAIERSDETVRAYSSELSKFGTFLVEKKNAPVCLEEITIHDMEKYLHQLKLAGLAPATRSRVIHILRSFYNFACKVDYANQNIAAKLETIKVPQKEREYLTENQLSALVAAIESPLIKVVVTTLFMTGLRVSEATNLTLDDVNLETKIINVIAGKGNKDRKIPIGDKLHGILVDYIKNTRPDVQSNKFFATKRTGTISPVYINSTLKKTLTKLGWNRNVTCHTLRHSFASHLVRKNINLVKVQKLLGHANLKTTSIYTHSSVEDLVDAVNAF